MRSFLARYGPLLALAGIAIAVSFAVRHGVFADYSWNRDEPVYLWQARGLRAEQILTTDGGMPRFFQPWLTGARDGTFFSQYTAGWPLALTGAAIVFGSAGYALAFSAALAVVATYVFAKELTRDHTLALVSAAVMTASPIVVVQSGMYLGYLFSLGLGLLFGAALLAGLRLRRPWLLVAAGLLLGAIFLTRPFDAVLWGAPLVAYAAFVHWHEWKRLARAGAWLAAGLVPLVVVALAYNRHVTGSFTEFPITAADPLDTFGFGIRRIMPLWTPVDYTIGRAFRGAGRNLFFLPQFLVGSFLGAAVAAVGLWLRRRDRSTVALVLLGLSFPVGYFFFWGIYLSGSKVTLSGPIYYIPLYGPLSILIATVILAVWRRRRVWGVAFVAVLAVVTGAVLADRLDANREISETQAPWRSSVEHLHGRALVIVDRAGPYLLHLNPFSSNSPDIDGSIVYAVDLGPANLDLIASRPHRTPYLQRTNIVPRDALDDPTVPTVTVTRIDVVRGATVSLHVRVTNPTAAPAVVTYLQVGERTLTRTFATSAAKGDTFETDWVIGGPGATGPDVVELPERLGVVAVGVGSGATPPDALVTTRVQQELDYRVDGNDVEVLTPARGVRIRVRDGTVHQRQSEVTRTVAVDATAG